MGWDERRGVPIEWLVRLRWFFLGGQLVLIALAHWVFTTRLNWLALALALITYGASNVVLLVRSRRHEASSPATLTE